MDCKGLMMETILYLANTESDGSLSKASLEALGAAVELSIDTMATFTVGLFGCEVQKAAGSIANCNAVRVLGLEGPEFAQPRYASDACAAEILCRASQATIVVTAGSSRMSRIMPGVTHRLAGRVDTHVNAIKVEDSRPVITRWFYRQRMVADVNRAQRPWILVVDPGTHAAYPAVAGTAKVEILPAVLGEDRLRTTVKGIEAPKSDAQTIRPDSELLFVAGAGWTKKQKDGQPHVKDAEVLILGFLNQTKASLGSSKSLVDISGEGGEVLKFMSHMNQVGQTGATPRHPKGLSTCCHGEEPHVVGWRFINERRAINLDPNCGWARGKADVLYVADAFEVMTKVNAMLAEKKATAVGQLS
jgi:electron transfer flavoprotein alpha subunit